MAGRRSSGLSLWQPGVDWLADDPTEPTLSYLPSRLWLIGLGNLGQAFAWLLACLPYKNRSEVELVLQDFDRIAESNDSTSLLSTLESIGRKKTRAIGAWLESIGFSTALEERRFGEWTQRAMHEPGVALCGVDNALARAALGKAGFDLVIEAGLGAGPQGFRNFSVHSFPASRTPEEIWSGRGVASADDLSSLPAYARFERRASMLAAWPSSHPVPSACLSLVLSRRRSPSQSSCADSTARTAWSWLAGRSQPLAIWRRSACPAAPTPTAMCTSRGRKI
jgi:hypothetical protein